MIIYGYCRVSKPTQKIERQIENITAVYPDARIIKEIHTRTSMEGRKEWKRLMRVVQPGDVIVFDSVSRMSGNEEEGFQEYKRLYEQDVELVFLKEPHINTTTYKAALSKQVELTGTKVDYLLRGVNDFLMALAEEQIRLAFQQSEKEVMDLRQRTREGLREAQRRGAVLGRPGGKKYNTKKGEKAKEIIRKHDKEFGGTLKYDEVIAIAKISKNTYYKYKREIREEEIQEGNALAFSPAETEAR